jgi:hypothetical protein
MSTSTFRRRRPIDVLTKVGASVSDSDLVTNVIKGLHERYDNVANIAPLLTPFPTFLNFHNMLLLQEMKVARHSPNTSASAFVAKGTSPTPASRRWWSATWCGRWSAKKT